ncbi:MAG: hypothetical protein JXB88_10765 [Spirochaetales bacterium]|nr:hypothetical protein [Spirochaetales bacterium]
MNFNYSGDRKIKHAFVVLLIITFLSCSTIEKEYNPEARILINTDVITGKVQPFVFGQNIEAADPKDIHSPDHNYTLGRTGDGLWDPENMQPQPQIVAAAIETGITMLRYPGGCLVHNFDWHNAVGQVHERPNFTFGIDEYIAFCRSINAEPLITCSAYTGGPEDMADLVEYCNAPASENFPWAMKRAQWGHPEPYNVIFWEMGNESDHGNHDIKPSRKHSPESYSDWVNQSAELMKAVDPDIKIGVLTGTGTGPADPWNSTVLKRTAGQTDFVVVHTYAVNLWGKEPALNEIPVVLQAAMASPDQIEGMLAEYIKIIKENTGRNIPMAITEYNAAYVQERPKLYRFSVAAALFSGDYIRVLLNPGNQIQMAHYWHFINGYWGMLRGNTETGYEKKPAYEIFRLWTSHTGKSIVSTVTESPLIEFEGWGKVKAAKAGNAAEDLSIQLHNGNGHGYQWQAKDNQSLSLQLDNYTGENYPFLGSIPVNGGRTVRLCFESRINSKTGTKTRLGIDVIDSRGWDKTRSGFTIDSIANDLDWQQHRAEMACLKDCTGMRVSFRLISEEPITADVEIRNLKLSMVEDAPPYPALTSFASLSEDKKNLYLVVFNKHHDFKMTASVEFASCSIESVDYQSISANELDAMTWNGLDHGELTLPGTRQFTYTFPKLSMTAFSIKLE